MFELALIVPKSVCEITETKILKRRSLSNQNIALAEPQRKNSNIEMMRERNKSLRKKLMVTE